jgi:hypothetical protein
MAEIEGGFGFFWNLHPSYAVWMADCLAPSNLQAAVLFHPNRRAKRGSGAYGSACAFVVIFYFLCLVVVVFCSYSVCLRPKPGL